MFFFYKVPIQIPDNCQNGSISFNFQFQFRKFLLGKHNFVHRDTSNRSSAAGYFCVGFLTMRHIRMIQLNMYPKVMHTNVKEHYVVN